MIVLEDRKLNYPASAGLHQLSTGQLLNPASTKTLMQGKALHGSGVKRLPSVTSVSPEIPVSVTGGFTGPGRFGGTPGGGAP